MERFLKAEELSANNTSNIYKRYPLVIDARTMDPKTQHDYLQSVNINELTEEYGAVLFRNFEFSQGIDEVLSVLDGEFSNFNIGGQNNRAITSKRTASASTAPKFFYIPQHSEWAYNGLIPDKLAFFCVTPPKQGGATVISNNRNVTTELPESINAKLNHDKIVFTFCRDSHSSLFKSKFARTSKQSFFNVDNDEDAARCMKELGFYEDPNSPSQICSSYPCFIKHPRTKEKLLIASLEYLNDYVFLNGAKNCFKFDKHKKFTYGAASYLGYMLKRLGLDLLPQEVKLHNNDLTRKEYQEFIRVLNRNKVYFSWKKNDLLMVDNFITMHGKQPYSSERKIVVSLGKLLDRNSLSAEL